MARRRERRRGRRRVVPPEPPAGLPEGRVVAVPGVGELFVRDTGGTGPAVLLLHGWLFPADTNWFTVYRPLSEAGYRVLAIDHRGHGRGLRSEARFRLTDCADDSAALVRELGCGPVTVVGYSMGGPIAALMARDHPDAVSGVVMCATGLEWQDPSQRVLLMSAASLRVSLGLFPHLMGRLGVRRAGVRDARMRTWLIGEVSRGSARDLAEAGREIGRYEAASWIGEIGVPGAVVVTTRDTSVPPRKQRELAAALRAPTFEAEGNHFAVIDQPKRFVPPLLEALGAVSATGAVRAA